MARKRVGAKELNIALEDILAQYVSDVQDETRLAAKEAGQYAVKELKTTSPYDEGNDREHYRKNWTMTEEKTRYSTGFTVFNKKKPGLAHLLEKGHAKRGGGRVEGIPHIAPAEENAIKKFESRLKERLTK